MEKRGSERVATRVMAEFFPSAGPESALENKTTGMTADISAGGLFVQTARLLIDGESLCLLLHLPGQEAVVLTGEIVRTVGAAEARAADLPAGFAVRLLYRPPDFTAYLSALNLPEGPA
jgi:hypothetical protein